MVLHARVCGRVGRRPIKLKKSLSRKTGAFCIYELVVFNADFAYNEGSMAQLTVRDIPDEVVKALRVRAAQNGRSAEAEHRLILAEAVRRASPDDFWARADARRRATKPQRTDSGRLQREMRDKR